MSPKPLVDAAIIKGFKKASPNPSNLRAMLDMFSNIQKNHPGLLINCNPVLGKKIELLIRNLQVKLDGVVAFNHECEEMAKLDRVVGTNEGLRRTLLSLPPNLEKINHCLKPVGFSFILTEEDNPGLDAAAKKVIQSGHLPASLSTAIFSNRPSRFLEVGHLELTELPVELSDIEIFRRIPISEDAALRLKDEGHGDEVAKIFMYELSKAQPDNDVRLAATNYFLQTEQWANLAAWLESTYESFKASFSEHPDDQEAHQILFDLAMELLEVFLGELGNTAKSRALLKDVINYTAKSSEPLTEESAEKILYYIYSLELDENNFPTAMNYLASIKQAFPATLALSYRAAMVKARTLQSLGKLPDKDTATSILHETFILLDDIIKQRAEELYTFIKFARFIMCWQMTAAGHLGLARETLEKYQYLADSPESEDAFLFFCNEAYLLAAEGSLVPAREAAKKALTIKPENSRIYRGMISTIENILKPTEAELARPIITAKTVTPAPKPETPKIDKLIFRDEWRHYYAVFPKKWQTAENDLRDPIFDSRDLLSADATVYTSLQALFQGESMLALPEKVNQKLEQLGIAKISLLWDNGLKVRFYAMDSAKSEAPYFEGIISRDFKLEIVSSRDLRLAQLLFEAIIFLKLRNLVFEGKPGFEKEELPEIEKLFP